MSDAQSLHDDACRRGVSGYIDPTSGLYVMSSVYLRVSHVNVDPVLVAFGAGYRF